jgi:drug/metabolite transporter (DMT)-like permease
MPRRLAVQSRRGAYLALAFLTLIWGSNWVFMKLALQAANPVVFNVQRTWLATVVLFAVLLWRRGPMLPDSWVAVIVTGIFQTTINFASTTMAVAGGGAGRTSVLVFTMPFWTLLLAWPVLHERIKGYQWLAVACALAGMVLLVEPWQWHGELAPKLWAVLSGFGWAAGTVATKYFQRAHRFDALNFIAWQMLVGVLPLTMLPFVFELPATQWSATFILLLIQVGAISTALGFLLWMAILRWLPAGTASLNMFAIPVIALLSSMAVFGERLTRSEWFGIGCIGAGLAIISADAWLGNRRAGQAVTEPTPLEGG